MIEDTKLLTVGFNMLLVILYFIQETIIPPSISVKPSSNISAGNNITIQCDGAVSGETFILYKNGREFLRQQSVGSETEFIIVNVSLNHQGNYFCMAQSNSRLSNHVRIAVQGAAEEKQRDYTRGNTIRISVAGALLVIIIVVVSEYCYREKKRTAEDN
ncbi:osteoclast-associated immunoglobulin-like receptor [Eleutherodactylus coqui]|uniref:osteoclast-associated immunoglobulin-like receptor n=1 Tax=Eleutherodactylus coqui TaxID=57060 RepID=UPI003462092A